jgi:hypothetical protein
MNFDEMHVGDPTERPLRDRAPSDRMQIFARDHKLFLDHGALLEGSKYVLNGRRFRLVNGAGKILHDVRLAYEGEAPSVDPADVVVCSGSDDDGGVPTYLTHAASASTVLRPRSVSTWITSASLPAELKATI